ncbi:MAG: hypothetical protein MjAS7_2188 [Metallosphaera javensis (ex Sakai et al. 2022)]|nr:MAG: hypothetical protein MjAS7_2188 [Metallosphaera javensis (ex Sakai et al. 2022)]
MDQVVSIFLSSGIFDRLRSSRLIPIMPPMVTWVSEIGIPINVNISLTRKLDSMTDDEDE